MGGGGGGTYSEFVNCETNPGSGSSVVWRWGGCAARWLGQSGLGYQGDQGRDGV